MIFTSSLIYIENTPSLLPSGPWVYRVSLVVYTTVYYPPLGPYTVSNSVKSFYVDQQICISTCVIDSVILFDYTCLNFSTINSSFTRSSTSVLMLRIYEWILFRFWELTFLNLLLLRCLRPWILFLNVLISTHNILWKHCIHKHCCELSTIWTPSFFILLNGSQCPVFFITSFLSSGSQEEK